MIFTVIWNCAPGVSKVPFAGVKHILMHVNRKNPPIFRRSKQTSYTYNNVSIVRLGMKMNEFS